MSHVGPGRFTLLPLSAVCLHGGPFKRAQDINAEHLEQVDVERLLVPYRRGAGIATDAEPYGGWESRSINGHSLGHYLSAVSLLHARALVGGALTPVNLKVYDDLRAGIVNASPFELNGAWVANYTLYKVLAGLHDAYRYVSDVDHFPHKLTPMTADTCHTYNLLKLTGHLATWAGDAEAADFAERAQLNHALANIGENPGEFGYSLGLGSVAVKVYSEPCASWWCCVGTGMENPTRYGELDYAASDDTLRVNLFLDNAVTWNGVTLRQETAATDEDSVGTTVYCTTPRTFTLELRHLHWCETPRLSVNGETQAIESAPSSHLPLSRTWQDGDVVDLQDRKGLRADKPGDCYELSYPLAAELTRGRTQVRVEFRPHPGSTAGPLFGLSVRRAGHAPR